jgi:hypothetical protein
MSRKIVWGSVFALASLIAGASPARADQKLSLNFGYFAVRGEDARVSGDVLVENRNFLAFEFKDFNNATIGGEYLVGLGDYFEAGAGVGYYRRTVPTIYSDFVDSDGTEIDQDLKLRITPVTLVGRLFPAGQSGAFQPYVGAGVALYNWRYSESGEFIDGTGAIFRDRFVADGNAAGPVVLGGLRFSNASQFIFGGEFRYQAGSGDLDRDDFLDDKIDLGGYTAQATFIVRF